jgi:alcohol dehydrogenase (cytochrome c)
MTCATCIKLASSLGLLAICVAAQQGLDPSLLLKPPTTAWPTYHGDYSGRHFSPLAQIKRSNVTGLTLAWVYRTNPTTEGAIIGGEENDVPQRAGNGNPTGPVIKSIPLMVNGVLYFSAPNHAYAVDAYTGRQIWHYFWRGRGAIGNRGMALWGRWLYFETPDNNVVSLDAASGKERWHKAVVPPNLPHFSTVAPVVVRNHVLTGIAGDAGGSSGWLEARDPETGNVQWRWHATPRAGQPGIETWPNAEAAEQGAGGPWQPPTYDPELNLIYVPTSNPAPVYVGTGRPGANLWTSSIVALNADTGKLVWYYQTSPHDTHDWDATEVAVLFDAPIKGQPRKLLAQANRNGYYFLLDRTNGENLLAKAFIPSANGYKGIDARGVLIPDETKEPQIGGTLVSPSSDGAANYPAPSFDPETRLFYFNSTQSFSVYYADRSAKKSADSGATMEYHTGLFHSALLALDYQTGRVKWRHDYPGTGFWSSTYPGVLTTAGKLLFSGDPAGNFVARDPATGADLWHSGLGTQITNSPETYLLGDTQYVVVAAADTLFAFALQNPR